MQSYGSKSVRVMTAAVLAAVALGGASCDHGGAPGAAQVQSRLGAGLVQVVSSPGTPVQLTAQRMSTTLRDGTSVPMWGFCTTGSCTGSWAPGPTIVAAAGTSLQIALTNELPVPTSLVVLGQRGGGLGAPAKMDGPAHTGQNYTTFPGNAPVNPPGTPPAFVPPVQGQRVRSFGTELPAASPAQTLTWDNLKPGTYLYETGTLPSLQVPMGLYGLLIVTTAPSAGGTFTPGAAYPGVSYDADVSLLLSEIDPAQNRAVDAAAVAGADVNKRFDDPTCSAAAPCYPAAVNYTPTTFLINGQSFDKTAPQSSLFDMAPAAAGSGNVLVRLANAGSRSHVPAILGLPMAIVGEDGNKAPGNPRVQNELLLTAGKTHDVLLSPPTAGGSFSPATYPVFDRSLSLTAAGQPEGGMLGFLTINHASAVAAGAAPGAPGMLPAAIVPAAVDDAFNVPFNTAFGGNVAANDVAVYTVALGTNVGHGTLALAGDGSFSYTPNAGFSGTDSFTYGGNGGAAGTATVNLVVAAQLTGAGNSPVANADSYTSVIAGKFSVARPGVLSNDTDPNKFPLTAGSVAGSTCASVSLAADGSFSATAAGASCQFTYLATNSQGTASAPATVALAFGTASNLSVAVVDGSDPSIAISDFRWTLQEDLTFKHDTAATPSLGTRSLGTSFHRSHMPVVATGCVGAISCGSGQTVLDPATGVRVTVGDAEALARQTLPSRVALDPSKNYYLSILPGDAGSPPGHAMGGAEVKRLANGSWAPLNVKLQPSPLEPAQMSVYVYEDDQPTNGQNEPVERPLGGFNLILNDPAGRTGDVAGQQTFDAFNMPLSNSLLGRPGCPDELNAATNGTGTTATGNLVGAIYTCPNDPNEGTPAADPAKYALAGHALIKNLTPARYDVLAHPGAAREAAGEVWWQTETLEGTQAQDAFVGIREPVYFQEFGPPGPHVTIGFVSPGRVAAFAAANKLVGTHSITGKVTNQHMSHPSDVTLWDSASYDLLSSTTCQVVLNSQAGDGRAIASAQCDPDGNFTLTGVPAGSFELAVFDQWLDQIIQTSAVTVPAAIATVALGDLPVLSWFTQYDQNIFQDLNRNGVYDPGEPGIANVPLTVRYRTGAPSNSTLTDSNGNGLLPELFPLFNWYVAEADTTRFKQTGVSVVVDGGGKTDATGDGAGLWASTYPTGESSVRTEIPGALSYGVQSFISQRNQVNWGRAPYAPGENGGVVGYVVYSSTRPFDDMRYNVQTLWEPLVPRVAVNLYKKETLPDGTETLTKVDATTTSSFDDFVNLVWGADGKQYQLGADNKLRDPASAALAPAAAYPAGAQVNLQCPGQKSTDPFVSYTLGAGDRQRCYDGFHNWNQVQAAPYDGRYVFPSAEYVAAHPLGEAQKAAGQTLVSLPAGTYVVEVVTPPGYEVVKEEDKNIFMGDAFNAPATQQFGALSNIFILPDQATLGNANPGNPETGDPGFQSDPTTDLGVSSSMLVFAECVGQLHRVPDFLSLFPQAQQVAPFAGMDRPLCDRKKVVLGDQAQASATFFVFTEVPAAANNTGMILDDASSEFNAAAPDFGEKASVPFVPVSIKDSSGQEISRTYSDQWGTYNMMTPSSWLVNPPTPSGYGPNMLVTCMNDPGPIADPAGSIDPATGKVRLITDPAYNPAYSNFCYTNPFMPGQTTYLDTPVLPIAAFAAGYNPADCALPGASPAIKRVDSSAGFGPWLPAAGGTLTITAEGDQQVLNPAYAGPFATGGLASQRTVLRHYGFGTAKGKLRIGNVDLTAATGWSDGTLTVNVPSGTPSGELSITTASGVASVDTVTVTLGGGAPTRVTSGGSLQGAIDAAKPGELILVDAGTYNELVVMWKPVRLQGVGASSVVINAAKFPTRKLEQWRPRINGLFAVDAVTGNLTGTPQVDPLPTQEITGGVVLLEPTVLGSEEGAGITVLAKNLPAGSCSGGAVSTWGSPVTDSNFRCKPSRIDGLSVTGGDAGGGIYVNGWAHGLEIANNRVYGNAGAFNGGVRVGVPYLELAALPAGLTAGRINGLGYDVGVKIHHNAVTKNGTVEGPGTGGGAGGGVSICAGTDGYSLDHNFICGNISSSDGGGIGHLGFSQNGSINNNQVLFNQSFQQTGSTHGGGIFVGGEPPIAGALTLGTGDVTIDANLVRGNFAEGGQGGGIRLQQVNGADVAAYREPGRWHQITLSNNLIVNNVAGWAGGGISLADTLRAGIADNTIASNDSTGIAGVVLAGGVALPGQTPGRAGVGYPSAAGIVSEITSVQLLAALPTFGLKLVNAISQPTAFVDNILWQNRSFYYSGDGRLCVGNSRAAAGGACTTLADQSATGQCPAGAKYWDLGVLGDASVAPGLLRLTPNFSVMTSTSGYFGIGNRSTNPRLVSQYCNGSRAVPELGAVLNPPTVLNLQVAATADEGNNYVNLRYGPLYAQNPVGGGTFGNYHLSGTLSSAYNNGTALGASNHDFDGQSRPQAFAYDIGADEFTP
ncbi:MAG TPA: Ig-like domain-containing protein [Myxococcales bacterium]